MLCKRGKFHDFTQSKRGKFHDFTQSKRGKFHDFTQSKRGKFHDFTQSKRGKFHDFTQSPSLHGSYVLECFEHSNAIEMCNGITFNFYPELPHMASKAV